MGKMDSGMPLSTTWPFTALAPGALWGKGFLAQKEGLSECPLFLLLSPPEPEPEAVAAGCSGVDRLMGENSDIAM
jgi:hypothetical protein